MWRLPCLAISSNRRRGKKSYKEGKYAISIIDHQQKGFTEQNVWMLEANHLEKKTKQGRGNKSNTAEMLTDGEVNIPPKTYLHSVFEEETKFWLALKRNKNIIWHFFWQMKGENLSKYKINNGQHGKYTCTHYFCIRKLTTINARIRAQDAYLIFLGEKGGANSKRGAYYEGARLFRLSNFSHKMTLSLFLFKCRHTWCD